MVKITIQHCDGVTVSAPIEVTKNEAKEAKRLSEQLSTDRDYAQRSADIWMRSAPTAAAQDRRKAVAWALGLSPVITFL